MTQAYDSTRADSIDLFADEPLPKFAAFDLDELLTALCRHVDSHVTCGQEWPADAVYALSYRTSTWPMGWDRQDSVKFFPNSEQLSAFVRNMNDWARLEDNSWRFSLYMWDLGPVYVTDERTHIEA